MAPLIFTAVLSALVTAGLAAVMFARFAFRAKPDALEAKVRRHVVVVLRSGTTLDGILYDVGPRWLELRQASVLSGSGSPIPADGACIIEVEAVDFLQAP